MQAVQFLNKLVSVEVAVEDPDQYKFDPLALLLDMTLLVLRLAEQPGFAAVLSSVPDYEEAAMASVGRKLKDHGLGEYEHRRRLAALAAEVATLRTAIRESRRWAREAGAAAGDAGGAADGGAEGPLDFAALAAAEELAEDLEERYHAELDPLALGTFDASLPRAYNRHFAGLAAQPGGDTPAKMKALAREWRAMGGRMRLPVHASAALFARHDGDRQDLARALITGPEGTPYAGGCFFFDAFFPGEYPNIPPFIELETTGG